MRCPAGATVLLGITTARYYSPTLGRFLQTEPIGYEDNLNLYTYVGNDPLNNTDPSGEASIFIARPLSGTNKAQHSFVIITTRGKDDRQSISARFSFGPVDSPGDNPLRNVTGSGDATDLADAGFANDVINNLNDGTALPDGVFTSPIDAPDAVTQAVGNAIVGNDDYETIPALQPGSGANSNSAAVALARRAATIAGNAFTPPAGATLPGAGDANNVQINEGQLQNDLQACRVEKTC